MTAVIHQRVAPTRSQVLSPGSCIAAHRHEEDQVVYSSRGILAIRTPSGSWIAPPDRAIWVPAGVAHEHTAYGSVELRLVGMRGTRICTGALGTGRPEVLRVTPLLRELIKECAGDENAEQPERRRMRAVLRDQLAVAEPLPGFLPAPTAPVLRDVAGLFLADPAEPRTLAELGRAVGASERTLSRLFKADVGMSFSQWRVRLRLHHALTLLADGLPVTTVAHRCGWSSASAFITAFKTAFGYTPGSRVR
ncbi:helix-turn-helix transcriptional regulator [Streptomyces smyrnaeus]|uniref:Helix-turn-helix transcriptional regulator n=1 Tax=Streptomyces smyrnaeus TaxID=1387713 RepID=A0ABS3XWP0_9ACTN|nr:helix-turn-helix transcriptional regulator [Streptomyces smyrnaeus]